MASKVYVPVAEIGAWDDAMEKLKHTEGLHRMMEFEIFNFADGKRNAFEVYEAVAAEALSAGAWYYGSVKPADVVAALEAGVKAGAFSLRGAK